MQGMDDTKPKHIIIDWDYYDFISEGDGRILSFDFDPCDEEIVVSGWPSPGGKIDRVPYRRVSAGRYERIA